MKSRNRSAIARPLALGLILLPIAGCQTVKKAYEPSAAAAPVMPVARAANFSQEKSGPAEGSIWLPEQSGSLFADDKAFRRGDILQVQVVQRNTGTKKANTGTNRKSSISANIKYALGFEDDINDLTNYTNKNPDGTKSEWAPNDLISATSSNEFKGEGSTERADVLQATVSALVTDVLSNGNLVIYGHQTVQLNNEASVLTVQGIVRPSDIGVDNTVDSSRLANANIQFTGSGVITDKQHPGWAIRIFDLVWPF